MNKIIKAICAVAVIMSFSLGVLGLFAPDSVMAANLGQTSVIYDSSYVSWVTSYGLPVSVQGTLQSQGITIRSSNTSGIPVRRISFISSGLISKAIVCN